MNLEAFDLAGALERIDRLEAHNRVLRLERDMARARSEHTVKILVRILCLLPPAPVRHDGKVFVYRDPDPKWPQRLLDALAAEIRAIPDQLAAEATQEFLAIREPFAIQSRQQAQTVGVPPTKTKPHPSNDG